MRIRDPFIFADTTDSTYYMHANSGRRSFLCYASKDLRKWRLCGESFHPEADFWDKPDFWVSETLPLQRQILPLWQLLLPAA